MYKRQVTSLDVYNKGISDLTGIAGFTALTTLNCSKNQLASLDLDSNTALTELSCHTNELTTLNVRDNTALTSLDVSNNTALGSLNCYDIELTTLNVRGNTALNELQCSSNSLTFLDVSSNTALTQLYCSDNQMLHLNMKNGITDGLTNFDATGNSLTCIEVNADDVAYATENWTDANGNIDDGVAFSLVCAVEGYTYVPDNNFEQALIDNGYDTVVDDFVLTENINGVTSLDVYLSLIHI